MVRATRRELLGGFGRGILAIGIGARLPAWAFERADDAQELRFGALEPLVQRIEESEPDALVEFLVAELRGGRKLEELIAAASLADARSLGGSDYEGYHAAMALSPSLAMSRRMSGAQAALPVLKVIRRTNARIRAACADGQRALRAPIEAEGAQGGGALAIRDAVRARELERAEHALALSCSESAARAFEDLQPMVEDDVDVHRVVLAWRMWETLPLCGEANAPTLFRQCVRFCVESESGRVSRNQPEPKLRALLPELLDAHSFGEHPLGSRRASDEEIEQWAERYFASEREDAARHAAEQLAAGYEPDDVGRALSLAASELLLRDPGSTHEASFGRGKGSVHGASVGLHASDAARAWREIARVVAPRSAAASLVAGAYHTAGQVGGVASERFPYAERRAELASLDASACMERLHAALASNDQALACAAAEAFVERGGPTLGLVDACLAVAVDADGALHAEKYFRTASQDHDSARPAHALRHALALARVSASEANAPAPGLERARALLAG